MEYRVDRCADGKTVLEIARRELGLSRAHIKHLKFLERGIVVNGKRVTVRYILKEGDVLSLEVEDIAPSEELTPVDIPLRIAYEDGDVAVPDKPSDMPTHPSHDHYDDTVANALAYRYAERAIPFIFRPVNRLDRNTSGLLLIARNRIAASRLTASMKDGQIRKLYVAILDGVPKEPQGIIETYMRRSAESIIVRENCGAGEGGDYALTAYRVICEKDGYALVCATPRTGRTHQLRVHFAGIGAPILGDDLYGRPSQYISRHALHSVYLAFPHPSSGSLCEVFSPLHEDMAAAARALFGDDAPDPTALAEICGDFLSDTYSEVTLFNK